MLHLILHFLNLKEKIATFIHFNNNKTNKS